MAERGLDALLVGCKGHWWTGRGYAALSRRLPPLGARRADPRPARGRASRGRDEPRGRRHDRPPRLDRRHAGDAACGIAAATGIVIAAASLANASATNAPAASAGYALGYGQQGTAPQGGPQGDRGPGGNDTPVTGSALTKVTAAVKAKDSAVDRHLRPQGPRRLLRRLRHQGRRPRHGRGQQGPQDRHRRRPAVPGGRGHGVRAAPAAAPTPPSPAPSCPPRSPPRSRPRTPP